MNHIHDGKKENKCDDNCKRTTIIKNKKGQKCDSCKGSKHEHNCCDEHEEHCHCNHEKEHGHEHHHPGGHGGCGCSHTHDHAHSHEHEHHNHEGGCGCGCGHDHDHGGEPGRWSILLYVVGALILLVAFLGEFQIINKWVGIAAAALLYVLFGRTVWVEAFENIRRGKIFTEFTLMGVASLGAVALLEFADAAAVMYLYSLGETVQGLAYRKSHKNISELIEVTEEYINKEENGMVKRIPATQASVGDVINITVGERISLDGVVVEGEGFADTSAVTGESAPLELLAGTPCLSGSVLVAGAVSLRVTQKYENSTASKLKAAVARAVKRKAKTEKRITKVASLLTPLAFALAVVIFAGGWIVWGDAARALKSSLVILVVSCPCSLVLSVPLTYFAGLGKAASRGIVFRGGEVVDSAAKIESVVFDKTGTLTSPVLTFDGIRLPKEPIVQKAQLLDISRAALAKSPHAAAQSFCRSYEAKYPHCVENVENIGGKGLVCVVDGRKAAFGNRALMADLGITVKGGGTSIYVAIDGKLCGVLLFSSHIKSDALPEIAKMRGHGVGRIAIMSGDTEASVSEVAEALGISEYYAELKPDEKLDSFENIYHEEKKRSSRACVAFCGDGLNDSAAIARADVGIAMGSGSAVTVESADVVVVDDSVARVNDMLSVAKSTVRVVNQNIALSFGIKLTVVIVGLLWAPSLELAIVADVGAAVITVLNAMRAGRIS